MDLISFLAGICIIWGAHALSRNVLVRSRMNQKIAFFGMCIAGSAIFFGLLSLAPWLIDESKNAFATRSGYCSADDAKPVVQDRAIEPGCELIYRAHKLGLISSLGTCEAVEQKQGVELCTLRQDDEPWLHYSFRRALDFKNQLGDSWTQHKFWKKSVAMFKTKLARLKQLTSKQAQVVQGVPRASHHIFTNLEKPNRLHFNKLSTWLAPNACLSQYAQTSEPFRSIDRIADLSDIFDEVYGRLLFSRRYDDPGGLCTEYVVHWNSPPDSCERMAENPKKFFDDRDLTGSIRVILKRLVEQRDLGLMNLELRTLMTGLPPPPPPIASRLGISSGKKLRASPVPPTVVSFQCLMLEPESKAMNVRVHRFELLGNKFSVNSVRFPRSSAESRRQLEMHHYIAAALVPGFDYSSSAKTQNTPEKNRIGPELFGSGDFPFSRLEYLKQADIFDGSDWVLERADLLDIYPYYHHVSNFVRSFRQEYHTQRTRL